MRSARLRRRRTAAPSEQEWGFAADEPLIVSVGRLVPLKNHALAISALRHMPRGSLAIVGEGPTALRAPRAWWTRRGSPIVLPSPALRTDATAVIGAADVVVLPSRGEGLPLVGLEALAAGTPFVATDVRGVRELLTDGENALLVAPDDAEALAAAITRVLDDGDLRERLRAGGLRLVAVARSGRNGRRVPSAVPTSRLAVTPEQSVDAAAAARRWRAHLAGDESSHNTTAAPLRVVFVCTGNRFRSPLGAALFAKAAGAQATVESAGTLELGARPAFAETIEEGGRLGVDLSGHRARYLGRVDLSSADLVLGFEQMHVATAVVDAGAERDRSFTLPELVDLVGPRQETPREAIARCERSPERRATDATDAGDQRSGRTRQQQRSATRLTRFTIS